MSSETDHPRQRTVAELLAAHGDANATGRRRRRREADGPDEGAPPTHGAPAADPPDWRSAPPREPDPAGPRDALPPPRREPAPRRPAPGGPAAWDAEGPEADRREDPWDSAPWASAQRDPAQRDPAQWDAGQWDADPWDADPREDEGRAAPPPQQSSWDSRENRYPGPPARGRAQRREPEEAESARSWDAGPLGVEPRSPREAPEAPWEARGPELEPNGSASSGPAPNGPAPSGLAPNRPASNGRATRSREARTWEPAQAEPPQRRRAGSPPVERPASESLPDGPTEQMPRVRDASTPDPARTTRIQQRRRPEPEADVPEAGDDDGGPATMVGAAPVGAEAWHRARTDGRRHRPDGPAQGEDDDDGPATMVGGAPAGAEAWHRARTDGRRGPADGGPPTQASAPMDFDDDEDDHGGPAGDYPAGLGRRGVDDEPTGFFAPDAEPDELPKRRSATIPEEERSSSPPWAAVIAQWIAGAIGGAALWVGFRFLWRDLPVVALAAAVLVTVGLVVVVRALLRSNDLRTTLFAVLVGLLLTVSPAILVLLGR